MRANKSCLSWVTLLVALVWIQGEFSYAMADSWGPPQKEHWSANRRFVLNVDDTKKRLTLQEHGRTHAKTLWSIPYPQPSAPETAYITDDGRSVVLQDQHGNLGYGKVFLFIGPSGKLLKSYTLEELLTQSEILHAPHSISSIWWSAHGQFFFTANQTRFACVTHRGTIRCFDLATGCRLDSDMAVRRSVRDESIMRARAWLSSTNEDERGTGIVQVGVLGDKESLSKLKSLMDYHRRARGEPYEEDDDGIQYLAGSAVVTLLQAESAPLLESHLARLPEKETRDWLGLYKQTGKARFSPTVRRLANSRNQDVRSFAIEALLYGGNPEAVRQNRSWLTDRDNHVRYLAILNLSTYGGKEDLPLLRIGLRDRDDTNEVWALRGLIRLNAPELPKLLHRCLRSRHRSTANEAQRELARRGDKIQLKRLVAWARSLHNHTHHQQGWGSEEMYAEIVFEILGTQRPSGAIPALRAAAQNPCVEVQRPAYGALATLGASDALPRIRRFARNRTALQRAFAIRWLARCHDHASQPFLQAALRDEDPIVIEEATRALKTLTSKPAIHR